jgi:hypothetical protein
MIDGKHDRGCPSYQPPLAARYCSICDDAIIEGEDYVEDSVGDCAHYECITSMSYRDMLEWAGCEVKTMESEECGYGET